MGWRDVFSLPWQKVLPSPTNPYLQLQTFPAPSDLSSHVALAWQLAHTSRTWPSAGASERMQMMDATHRNINSFNCRANVKVSSSHLQERRAERPRSSRSSRPSSLRVCPFPHFTRRLLIPIFFCAQFLFPYRVPCLALSGFDNQDRRRTRWAGEPRSLRELTPFVDGPLAAGGFVASSCHRLTLSVMRHALMLAAHSGTILPLWPITAIFGPTNLLKAIWQTFLWNNEG